MMSPPPPQSRRQGNSWEASNALRARAPSNCRLQTNHGCQVNPATIKLKINTPTSIAGNQSSSQNEQSYLFVPQLAQGDETSPSQQRPLPARSALLPQEGQLQVGLPFLAKHEAAHTLGEVHGDALLARVAHLFMSLPPIHSYSGGR